MRTRDRGEASNRMVAGLLLGLSLFSFVYFCSNLANGNSISRIALTLSLIERQRVDIDPFADFMDDRASDGVHFYSDKAPGMSFLAIPVAAAALSALNPNFDDGIWRDGSHPSYALRTLVAICTVCVSGLVTACSVVVFRRLVLRLGGSDGCAIASALIYALGTPVWLWATTFFGHSVAAGLLVIGLHAAVVAAEPGVKRSLSWAAWSGVALSWAVLVEFTAAIPLLMVMAFFVARLARATTRGAAFATTASLIGGGLPALAALLIYNGATFGSLTDLGYGHVTGFDGLKSGFFGISAPRPEIMAEILIGGPRGILWLSPILALAPVGAALALASRWRRGLALLCAGAVAYYILLNSGYHYWEGGYSTGPRHITACLPFACLLLVPVWERWGLSGRLTIGMLGALSGGLCLIAVSVDVVLPEINDSALFDHLLPRFWRGDYSSGVPSLLGLTGIQTVLPFLITWAVGGTLLALAAARRGTAVQTAPLRER